MNEIVSSNLEVDLSVTRQEGPDLRDVEGKRVHRQAKTGFGALSNAV